MCEFVYPERFAYHPKRHPLNSPRRNSMTNLSRFTKIGLALGLAFASASWAQERPPIAEQIAKTYGFDSFGQIEGIRYTWHAQFGKVDLSRTWTWEPKADRVTYEGKDKDGKPVKVTYVRSQLSSQPTAVKEEIDPGFVNDHYWLLFPFHVVWDTAADVKDMGMKKLPLGKGTARQVVVKYPSDVGYTPGDTWTLFVGPDNLIKEFTYHRGGPKKPTLVIATWAEYKKAGPLLVSQEHRGTADGSPFHLFFTDVSVKLAGSNDWVNAQ
jgi:hypothetical protein